MAERSVSVRLSANVAAYQAGMAKAKAATSSMSSDSQRDLTRLGTSMQSIGRTATLGITAPLVGLGGVAVRMASDFESSFARMQGLAGVSADEIDGLQASVMELAGRTATAPQELADALYFLRSSGLDSADAMDALEMSAMASAAGLGDTATIADAVSSAMNAYAASGLSAAEATDILVSTARAGKAEPAELAGALGRVLPIASELGVTFEDVGGSIAAFSLGGLDASESTTLLSNVLMKLLKQGPAAAEALQEVGLSTEDIRRSIADDGLLATLQMLQDRLGDTGMLKFFEDQQAVLGIMTLLGDESGTVAAAFDNVANHVGATGEAFDAMASTDAMKMKQALVDLQTAMITVGQVLLPIVADIASGIADLAGWFNDLNPTVQKVVLALAGVAAAAGPVLIIAGSLVRNWKAVTETFTKVGGAAGKASLALGAIGLAVTAGFMIYQAFTAKQKELEERTHEVAGALGEQTAAAWDLARNAEDATGAIDGLTLANEALGRALATTGEDGDKIREAFGTLGLSISDLTFVMDMLQGDAVQRGSMFDEMGRSAGVASDVMMILSDTIMQTDDNGDALFQLLAKNLQSALGITADEAFALAEQLMPVAEAMEELDDQSEKFDGNAATREFLIMAAGSNDLANSLLKQAEAQTGLTRNGEHTRSLMAALLEIIEALPPEAEAAARAAFGLTGGVDALAAASEAAVETTGQIPGIFHDIASLPQSETAPWVSGKWIDGIRVLNDELKDLGNTAKTNPFGEMLGEGLNDSLSSVPERIRQAFDELSNLELPQSFSLQLSGNMAGDLEDIGDAADDTEGRVDTLIGTMDRLISRLTDETPADRARSAFRDVNAAVDDMAAGLQQANEDGIDTADMFDVSTDAGRRNEAMLEDARDAIYANATAMVQNGSSAEEASASVDYFTGELRNNMLQAGFTEEEVDALIATYFRTPEEVETDLRLLGLAQAQYNIATHKAGLGSIPGSISTAVNVQAFGISNVMSALASLTQSRTVKIFVDYSGSLSGKRAAGGPVLAGEAYTVGEEGMETFVPAEDGYIVNARDTRAMLAGSTSSSSHLTPAMGYASGATVNYSGDLIVNMPPGSRGDDVVAALQKYQRRNGPVPIRIAGLN